MTGPRVGSDQLPRIPGPAPLPAFFQLPGVGSRVYNINGVPPVTLGINGDYAFRKDGGGAGATHLYFKNAGAWLGIA